MRLGHSSKDTFVPELIDGSQQTKTKRKDEKDKKWKGPRVKGLDKSKDYQYVNFMSVTAGSAHSMALVLTFKKSKCDKIDTNTKKYSNNLLSQIEKKTRDKRDEVGWTFVDFSEETTDKGTKRYDYRLQVVVWGRNDGRLGLGLHGT